MYFGRRSLFPVSALKLFPFLKQICFQSWQKPIYSPSQHVDLVVSILDARCGEVCVRVFLITCWSERGCVLKPEHRSGLVFTVVLAFCVTVEQSLSNVWGIKEASKARPETNLTVTTPSLHNGIYVHSTLCQRQTLRTYTHFLLYYW